MGVEPREDGCARGTTQRVRHEVVVKGLALLLELEDVRRDLLA